jgi:hypothetical protein
LIGLRGRNRIDDNRHSIRPAEAAQISRLAENRNLLLLSALLLTTRPKECALSAYAFPTYVLIHASVCGWCIFLATRYRAPGAALTALIAAGLFYDNLIVSLGATIGPGWTLQTLSWPRFALHALLTPFTMIAVTQMAVAGGIRWAASDRWKYIVWTLVVGMMVVGAFEGLIGLQTVPACFDGILRYTANLYPSHFCYEGQEAGSGSGPPIPSIVGNVVTLVVGFALWRANGWPWLLLGALLMFGAAAVPISGFGMAPSNAGESLLMLTYAATLTRYGYGPRKLAFS